MDLSAADIGRINICNNQVREMDERTKYKQRKGHWINNFEVTDTK